MGIKEEIEEIYQEMKDDFKKGKEYAYQYRKTIFWIFIAFITMQFTDILSLGASWENMCQNNPNLKINKKQKGGAEGDNAPKGGNDASKGGNDASKGGNDASKGGDNAAKGGNDAAKGGNDAAKSDKAALKASKNSDAGGGSSFRVFDSFRSSGPLSNFFSRIGGFIKGGFIIIGILLSILVVSFLPILIFCIILYGILKFIAKYFTSL
jgi:hypothetical protein